MKSEKIPAQRPGLDNRMSKNKKPRKTMCAGLALGELFLKYCHDTVTPDPGRGKGSPRRKISLRKFTTWKS